MLFASLENKTKKKENLFKNVQKTYGKKAE